MNVTYTGELVRLRPFKDEKEYCDLHEATRVVPNPHWGPWWHPRQEAKKDFDEKGGMLNAGKYSAFAVERLDTGDFVGLEEYGGTATGSISAWLGTEIIEEHWHNGFGIEAKKLCLCHLFENFPVGCVHADTLENHTRAAQGLFECGMSYEGRYRKVHHMDGKQYDIVQYCIFREEWEQLDYRHKVKRGAL